MYPSRIVLPIYLRMVCNMLHTIIGLRFWVFHPLCAASISRKEAEV
jgi:hypothetical protein